jgi:hypothetical protein
MPRPPPGPCSRLRRAGDLRRIVEARRGASVKGRPECFLGGDSLVTVDQLRPMKRLRDLQHHSQHATKSLPLGHRPFAAATGLRFGNREQRFRVLGCDPQQDPCGPLGSPSALLPVPQGVDTDAEEGSEFRLRQVEMRPQCADVCRQEILRAGYPSSGNRARWNHRTGARSVDLPLSTQRDPRTNPARGQTKGPAATGRGTLTTPRSRGRTSCSCGAWLRRRHRGGCIRWSWGSKCNPSTTRRCSWRSP